VTKLSTMRKGTTTDRSWSQGWWRYPALLGGIAAVVCVAVLLGRDKPKRSPEKAPRTTSQTLSPVDRTTRPGAPATPRFVQVERSDGQVMAKAERQARDVMTLIVSQLLNEARALEPLGIEAAGNAMTSYLKGALATLRLVEPSILAAMKVPLVERVCKQTVEDVELMLYARMVIQAPEVASERGFDCAFQRHSQEDALLWTLLDGFQATGLPVSGQVATLQRNATDERTKWRFMTPDERRAHGARQRDVRVVRSALTSEERQRHAEQ
jgi:hypothetical protein